MPSILHVDSSSRSESSTSRKLSSYLVEALTKQDPTTSVKYIDLVAEQPPFVSEASWSAAHISPAQHSPEQKKAWSVVEKYTNDVIAADIFVFGVPMYNFSVPAIFKAFIDLTVIAGKTFSYDQGVLKPLLHNKKMFVLTASGGNYDHPPASQMDFLEPYLRTIFGFIGVTDITFVKASGHSPDEIASGIANAKKQIDNIVTAYRPAAAAKV